MTLSSAPRADGTYSAGAQVSIIAISSFGTFPPSWGGVDLVSGDIAAVEMNVDRFVVVILFTPTPTPKPVINVGGTISINTNWLPEFTYAVTSDVVVPKGIILTIKPGTLVKFRENRLDVSGTLNAEGTSELPITFTSDSIWGGIRILDTSLNSRISHAVIEKVTGTALDVDVGSLSLRNSIVRLSNLGIHIRSSLTSFYGNEIYSNDIGVIAGTSTNVVLDKHTIRNNGVGIRVVGPTGTLLIRESNLMGNSEFNVLVFGTGNRSVAATGNWWGTADKERIEGAIFHVVDDGTLAEVIFQPFETARVSAAP